MKNVRFDWLIDKLNLDKKEVKYAMELDNITNNMYSVEFVLQEIERMAHDEKIRVKIDADIITTHPNPPMDEVDWLELSHTTHSYSFFDISYSARQNCYLYSIYQSLDALKPHNIDGTITITIKTKFFKKVIKMDTYTLELKPKEMVFRNKKLPVFS